MPAAVSGRRRVSRLGCYEEFGRRVDVEKKVRVDMQALVDSNDDIQARRPQSTEQTAQRPLGQPELLCNLRLRETELGHLLPQMSGDAIADLAVKRCASARHSYHR